MKSSYFTSETINNKSLEMLRKLEKFVGRHKIDFIPERSALLILDMQRFFLEERSHAYIPSALPIIPKIKSLATAFNESNLPIIFTRHLNTEEDAKLMARWWRDFITEEDDLSWENNLGFETELVFNVRKCYYAYIRIDLAEMTKPSLNLSLACTI